VHRYYARIRKGGNRKWRWKSQDWVARPGAPAETFEMQAHEREAFEKFSRYMYDAREDDSLVLSTPDIKSLPAMERFNQLIPRMAKALRVRSKDDSANKMKMTLELCECFEEYSQLSGMALDEMPEEHQREFAQAAEAVMSYARASHRHMSHRGAPAACLRLADVADQLRCVDLRDRAMAQARVLATQMDDVKPVPMYAEQLYPLPPERGTQLGDKFVQSPANGHAGPRQWADSGLSDDDGTHCNLPTDKREW